MGRERFFLELEHADPGLKDQPHVVIVGGGFAGLAAAKTLADRQVRVTLIDKRNFNLFQPLLYQVSTGMVSESDVASPLRQLLGRHGNVQVLLGEVEDIDVAQRTISFNQCHYAYDHLILATGSGSSYFGHDDWRQLAPAMKILEHADEIRRRLLSSLEEAEQTPDPERRRFLQSVVVIGGGPSGCELAGSLSDLMCQDVRRFFQQVDPEQCRITLVDPGDRLLRSMHPSLSAAAAAYLRRRGVDLLLGCRVTAIDAEGVTLQTPEGSRRLEAGTICWTAGVRASHLAQVLARASGCSLDRGGRVEVLPDFSIPGHPEIRVIGDLCHYSHTSDGQPLPGMAGPAVQMGAWVARDLLARHEGRRGAPFRWFDMGSMAVIGPLCAVADLRGIRVSGPIGWLLWGLAHLAFMPAHENRLTLLTKWLWQIATRERASLLITGRRDQHLEVEVGLQPHAAASADPQPELQASGSVP